MTKPSKLLHISASPRGNRSASISAANHLIAAYQAKHPSTTAETLDLWTAGLPEFDNTAVEAKFASIHGEQPAPEQVALWNQIVAIIDHFKSADTYIVSTPMWNLGIPYKLKHYIDLITQAGQTFSFTPGVGYKGLVTGKTVILIYSSGGTYAPGTPTEGYDLQSRYLRQLFGFIGFTDIREVFVDGTMAGPTAKDESLVKAKKTIESLVETL
jgi:FMN-dependent NADH-azoreductase